MFSPKLKINHDQIHNTRNDWLDPNFFSPGDSSRKGFLALLHLNLESVTEVETDPKRRFLSFKITPSKDRVLHVYAPLGHNTRKQLARGHFFEGLQIYMENESEGNKRKMILGDFDYIMDKIGRNSGNKTQRLYRCGCKYALSKPIVDQGSRI